MRPITHGYYNPGDEFRIQVAGCWFSLDIRCGYWHLGIGRRVEALPVCQGALPVRVIVKWHITKRVPGLGRRILARGLCKRQGRLRSWSW